MGLIEECRKRADEIGTDWGDNKLFLAAADEIESLKEVLDDTRRLTRELDVAMSGEENAAKQASLCDLIPQAKRTRLEVESLKAQLAECRDKALEEAVQVCEDGYERFQKMDQFNYAENRANAEQGCTSCAEEIRSLKGANHDPT